MKHEEGTFQAYGMELYTRNWQPEGPVRAVIALIHGIGEHSSRYMNVVNHFVPRGYAVYGFDHRGHGRSPGRRGYVNAFADFREDVWMFLQMVQRAQPERPIFVYGHSLGGLITLNSLLHHPDGVHGVVCSAPAIGGVGVPPLLLTLARMMSRVWPTFTMETKLPQDGLSRDPAVSTAVDADPLMHTKGTARLGAEVEAAQAWTNANAHRWQLPLLMIHGDGDRLTDPASSRSFFDNVPVADKQYILYPGGYHESHNDIHHEQVMADVEAWMEARVGE